MPGMDLRACLPVVTSVLWLWLWLGLGLGLGLGCTGRTFGSDEGDTDGAANTDGEYVKASNADVDQLFGTSVALADDGEILAVGAPWEASEAKGINGDQTLRGAPQAGAVYVFIRNADGELEQQAYIKAANADAGDRFGNEVALSADGETLAVSAPREASNATDVDGDDADNSVPDAGAVYVFVRDANGEWIQDAYLKANGEAYSFGSRMVLSGDGATLAAVALLEPAIYIFTRGPDGEWSRQAKLNNVADDGFDYFGASMALSADGDTLALGGPGDDSDADGVDGDDSDDSAGDSGAVRVFVRNAQGVWSQQAYIKASNTDAGDGFSSSVALSGSGHVLAVGAVGERSDATGVDGGQADDSVEGAGAVYVFERDAQANWSQTAYIKASNTDANDHFGSVVRLSSDGETLAVSAHDEDSDALGFDGDEDSDDADGAGAVYVFTREGGSWEQAAYVKATNTGAGDVFGFGAALSGDGEILAVGAPSEASGDHGVGADQRDDSAPLAGAVYVYDLTAERD